MIQHAIEQMNFPNAILYP